MSTDRQEPFIGRTKLAHSLLDRDRNGSCLRKPCDTQSKQNVCATMASNRVIRSHRTPTLKSMDLNPSASKSLLFLGCDPSNLPMVVQNSSFTEQKRTFEVFTNSNSDERLAQLQLNLHHEALNKDSSLRQINHLNADATRKFKRKRKPGSMFVTELWSGRHLRNVQKISGLATRKEKLMNSRRASLEKCVDDFQKAFDMTHTDITSEAIKKQVNSINSSTCILPQDLTHHNKVRNNTSLDFLEAAKVKIGATNITKHVSSKSSTASTIFSNNHNLSSIHELGADFLEDASIVKVRSLFAIINRVCRT